MHFGRIVVPPGEENKICSQSTFSASTKDNPSVEWPDGGRELLALSSALNDGSLITQSNAKAVCNTGAGGGLIVTIPDGTKYTMDKIDLVNNITSWLTTRIEDVHGNFIRIEYEKNAGLTYPIAVYRGEEGATAVVTFEYIKGDVNSTRLSKVTANGQIWEYQYEVIDSNYVFPVYQLSAVVRPDGKKWLYRYNAMVPDPDPSDNILEYGPGSFSINGVTYPDGAVLDYTYQTAVFDPGSSKRRGAIHTKNLTGTGLEAGTWTYEFAPASLPIDTGDPSIILKADVTTVTSPINKTVYTHFGLSFHADTFNGQPRVVTFEPVSIGLLFRKSIYSLSNQLLEKRAYNWSSRLISNEKYYHGEVSKAKIYARSKTYAPVLSGELVARDGGTSGSSYSIATQYADYDQFGLPAKVTEISSNGQYPSRVTNYTYNHDTVSWILGLSIKEELYTGGTVPTLQGTITRVFNNKGQMEEENRFGVSTQYQYHTTGDLKSVKDANLNLTTYSSYKRGIAQNESWPEGVNLSRSVNATGTIARETDGNNKSTTYRYDTLNRLTAIHFPVGDSVAINYSATTPRRTLTRGKLTQVDTFDGLGRMLTSKRTDTLANDSILTTMKYDALGRKTFESYPNVTTGTAFSYDALDRITLKKRPDGSHIQYAHNGFITQETNELNQATTYRFLQHGADYSNRMMDLIIQPENIYTIIKRNRQNQIVSFFQGEDTGANIQGYYRLYTYTNHYFLASEEHIELGQLNTTNKLINYTHDKVGNVLTRTVGDTPAMNYVYDKLNRVVTVDYATGDDVNLTYTLTGKNKTVFNTLSQKTYTYDDNDNLTSESTVVDGTTYTVTYTLDTLDAVNSITYPSGRVVTYAPDAFGRPTQAAPYATEITHHPSGQLSSMTYANGQSTSIALNNRLNIASIRSVGATVPMDLAYAYDKANNILSMTNNIATAHNRSFTYDAVNRLKTASGSWGNKAYSYDAQGNMLAADAGVNNYVGMLLASTDNPATMHTDISYQYDTRGNIVLDDRRSTVMVGGSPVTVGPTYVYTYNDAMQLSIAKHYDASVLGGTLTYSYDGDGHRLKRVSDTNTSYSIYSKRGQLLGEYDAAGVAAGKEYFYVNAMPIAAAKSTAAPLKHAVDLTDSKVANQHTLAPRKKDSDVLLAPGQQTLSAEQTKMVTKKVSQTLDVDSHSLKQAVDIGLIQSLPSTKTQGGAH